MRRTPFRVFCVAVPALLVFAGGGRFVRPVGAQNQEMQERVAEIKQAAAQNREGAPGRRQAFGRFFSPATLLIGVAFL